MIMFANLNISVTSKLIEIPPVSPVPEAKDGKATAPAIMAVDAPSLTQVAFAFTLVNKLFSELRASSAPVHTVHALDLNFSLHIEISSCLILICLCKLQFTDCFFVT